MADLDDGEPVAGVRAKPEVTFPARLGAANGRDQPLTTSPEVSRMSGEVWDPTPSVETAVPEPGLVAAPPA